ncbi:hypothetical protein FOZ76_08835 [Verticiella sediminum]|uniref:Uncharacterized protein n=1 Tax=Verticiella sediminum TaxID=1247510 RepID=A0A556AUU2_9BURK|nr:hypothetical protein [Verticiella sediminum]TSH96670.1 hypothetical protein FOZ76_08835 [Verticiella sediminum]
MCIARFIALFVLVLSGGLARAEGLGLHDLTTVAADVAQAMGAGFRVWAAPDTMNLSCCEKSREQIVMLSTDRQTDELGQSERSDSSYIAELEETCSTLSPACEIENIDIDPAIGRLISLRRLGGDMTGTRIVVVKDGERLVVQSAANDRTLARSNAETALSAVKGALFEQGQAGAD